MKKDKQDLSGGRFINDKKGEIMINIEQMERILQ